MDEGVPGRSGFRLTRTLRESLTAASPREEFILPSPLPLEQTIKQPGRRAINHAAFSRRPPYVGSGGNVRADLSGAVLSEDWLICRVSVWIC